MQIQAKKFLVLFRENFTPKKILLHSEQDEVKRLLLEQLSQMKDFKGNLSLWEIDKNVLPDITAGDYIFEVYLCLLDKGELLATHENLMEQISHLEVNNLFNKMEHNQNELDSILNKISSGLASWTIGSNDIESLNELSEDIERNKFSIDEIKKISLAIDKYHFDSGTESFAREFSDNYLQEKVALLDRIDNFCIAYAENENLEVEDRNFDKRVKDLSEPFSNNESAKERWPVYNPSDPDWMGAAEELKFKAEQLNYELSDGDLQNLEYLSKKLISMEAGRQLGDLFVEAIEETRYLPADHYTKRNEFQSDKLKSNITHQNRYEVLPKTSLDIYPNGNIEILCTHKEKIDVAISFMNDLNKELKKFQGLENVLEFTYDKDGKIGSHKMVILNSIMVKDRLFQTHILNTFDSFSINYSDTGLIALKQIIEKEIGNNLKKKIQWKIVLRQPMIDLSLKKLDLQ